MSVANAHDGRPVFNDADDDDGMPPLVDNPAPFMTFTFMTDMTPITYGGEPNVAQEVAPESWANELSEDTPPTSPAFGPTRVSHAKKRDASYIPRPPNAFILFRSSFIRAQHIPGKIEGNHSALSKIIGKYWKSLPREEREVWEAKAIVAQAEHRKKYPDWRFRPGANALAKVKDGPKRRSNKKGRGESEKEERSREKRCAKIADLLVAGKTGVDLATAIEEYDSTANRDNRIKEEGSGAVVMNVQEDSRNKNTAPSSAVHNKEIRSRTPGAASDARFKVPLTAMFKRSSSAPVARSRYQPTQHATASDVGSDISEAASPTDSWQMRGPALPALEHEVAPRVSGMAISNDGGLPTGVGHTYAAFPDVMPVMDFARLGDSPVQWNDGVLSLSDTECSSPAFPTFESDCESAFSPAQSPSPFCLTAAADFISGCTPLADMHEHDELAIPSPYSSLRDWAGDTSVDMGAPATATEPFIVSPVPYELDSGGIMRDAFEAAASIANANYWGDELTTASAGCLPWASSGLPDFTGAFQQCAPCAQDLGCRQDNVQLFDPQAFAIASGQAG
ncbi:hypothetical protein OBBRIDRAFT_832175 [Obba rivulosa]|uniref:HMG box domain-containing protein n=1 Tax=Obba rivulosa TaxID=1052685 RepID=A0A8E2DQS5_9APHY|nr:hypothetical protein OBBRIDRAFT_832175 [Obba rivulosa]